MIQTKTHIKNLYTPLRYPGGKTSLYEFFDKVIQHNNWKDVVYIEPYAGGAGAAVTLLVLGKVSSIVINDYDQAIYSFWKSILESTNKFVKKIMDTPISVEEWEIQKKIYNNSSVQDTFDLGFATFYLNRTNRSGILNAGPVGGKAQAGEWKIDARYNKEKLVEKIRIIASFRDQITVLNEDGVDVIRRYSIDSRSFFYIDPPYFDKGAALYLNAFKLKDHKKLARVLNARTQKKWLLSYDNEQKILELYKNRRHEVFNLRYSAHHDSKMGSELMIFSDVTTL